jgi:hypothetical protein|tara:strand:- start:402 stop:524 length:123 start_codon:yes stop_codon:yes gene_type:complete
MDKALLKDIGGGNFDRSEYAAIFSKRSSSLWPVFDCALRR